MKKGIHPNYVDCTITCACGNVIHTRDTKPEIRVEVCSNAGQRGAAARRRACAAEVLNGFFIFKRQV